MSAILGAKLRFKKEKICIPALDLIFILFAKRRAQAQIGHGLQQISFTLRVIAANDIQPGMKIQPAFPVITKIPQQQTVKPQHTPRHA